MVTHFDRYDELQYVAIHEIVDRIDDRELAKFGLVLQSGGLVDDRFWQAQVQKRFRLSYHELVNVYKVTNVSLFIKYNTCRVPINNAYHLYCICAFTSKQYRLFELDHAFNSSLLVMLIDMPDIDRDLFTRLVNNCKLTSAHWYIIESRTRMMEIYSTYRFGREGDYCTSLIKEYGPLQWWRKDRIKMPEEYQPLMEMLLDFDMPIHIQEIFDLYFSLFKQDPARLCAWIPLWEGQLIKYIEDEDALISWIEDACNYLIKAGKMDDLEDLSDLLDHSIEPVAWWEPSVRLAKAVRSVEDRLNAHT